MEKMINVCHIISGDLWAGAETQAFNLIFELSKSNTINVNVITFNSGILVDKLKSNGIQIKIFDESRLNFVELVNQVSRHLKQTDTEVVHVHGFKENFIVGLAAFFLGHTKIIRTFHGKGLTNSSLRYQLVEKVNCRFFCNQIISVSRDLKNYLVSYGIQNTKIKVIHNGISQNLVKPQTSSVKIKDSLGLPRDALVIGTLGRMVRVKGHDIFLEGAKKIVQKYPDVYFVLAGDGPLMKDAQAWKKANDLDDNVKIVGFRDDPYNILNILDIFVLTSRHEGIPMVLLEAMCLGKPLIVTEVGGIPEIISEGKNGILIAPGDSQIFADSCMELIRNGKLRNMIGQQSKQDLLEKHTAEATAEKVVLLYSKEL